VARYHFGAALDVGIMGDARPLNAAHRVVVGGGAFSIPRPSRVSNFLALCGVARLTGLR
jgi:hypothetical protein